MSDLHPQTKAIIAAVVGHGRRAAAQLRRELELEAKSEQAILYLDELVEARQSRFEREVMQEGGVKRGNMIVLTGGAGYSALAERIDQHNEAYRQLINGRITLDRVVVDELVGCDLKPKRKSYSSPYYPDSAQRKARKARR